MATGSAAQDDARENRLVDLFNLVRPENRMRHGTDALLLIDGHKIEFELKSVTRLNGSVSTVRDLGPDHIAKWTNKHWIVAFFDGTEPLRCRYGSPAAMAPWVSRIWKYIKDDFEMAKLVPGLITADTMASVIGKKDVYTLADAKRLHKSQYTTREYNSFMDIPLGYSTDRMLEIFRERAKYVIERGSTLNNPHIPYRFFSTWPEISSDYAVSLRDLVKAWIIATPAQQIVQAGSPSGAPPNSQ